MPRKKVAKRITRRNEADYVDSPVIRIGIVFFFILVIIVVAYVVKYFTP